MLKLYVNHAPHAVYIGGRSIPPGEAREVDAALIPAPAPEIEYPPPDAPKDAGDPGVEGDGLPAKNAEDLSTPAAEPDTPMASPTPEASGPRKASGRPR